MKLGYLTQNETSDLLNRQLFSLESGIVNGYYSLPEIGDLVPGAIIVHEMKTQQVTYMNDWGCETLGHSMAEINAMGEAYYQKFFRPEEIMPILHGMADFYQKEDETGLHCFFHQVRTLPDQDFSWYYAACKLLRRGTGKNQTTDLIMVVNPIAGMGLMVNKVNKLLDENLFISKNYKNSPRSLNAKKK